MLGNHRKSAFLGAFWGLKPVIILQDTDNQVVVVVQNSRIFARQLAWMKICEFWRVVC